MKHILNTVFLSVLLLLSSCERYLEVNPDSTLDVEINSEEKIAELLTAAYPEASYSAFLEARTDNVEERVNGVHSRLNEAMYFWEDYDQEDLDTPLNYWNSCYKGIAQANKALELLASYPKTDRVKALYGEAFLIRAYLHFMLVNIWSAPYGTEKSKNSLGIPYLEKSEKNALVDYKRGTVAEVYEKIERDLKLGISLVSDDYYQNPKFHFNKKAAYAFASRFYLIKGEWDLVIEYSNFVLGADAKQVIRNWNEYMQQMSSDRTSLYTLYTSSSEPANLLLSTTESRIKRNISNEKYGSTTHSVTNIFAKKGIDGCSEAKTLNLDQVYTFAYTGAPVSNGRYLAKFDELSLFGNTGIRPRGLYVTNVLFSVDEVLLNRMEAYTMKKNYSQAVDDLLDYMKGKFDIDLPCSREMYLTTSTEHYATYTPFYGLTVKQLAMVKTITELRQKEFFHEGLRWFDIRRFYLPVTRNSKNSLYRPLTKEDPRKLLQIPAEAINRGLEPNPR
ncbi:RagB/SusD family nutrient uptake outer membrane protein [Bergeyella porcorum]|uniref:RagB/SusD family nutrient uptake outer membrane protein n=1 Tax=Bergeyella porcorum TaxID=1735111 RepID=UPI0035EE584D